MRVYNDVELFNHLKEKGIKIKNTDSNLFKKYDYFQVINGYKGLFIKSIETLDDIYNNVDKGIDISRYENAFSLHFSGNVNGFKEDICDKLIDKYGLKKSTSTNLTDKSNQLIGIKYIHHIYHDNVYYGDFVRMYQFEHSLRNMLLKYTLLIEENIKRIFISYINNSNNANENFLMDLSNYNNDTTSQSCSNVIKSLKEILDLKNNKHSNPIQRKLEQELPIPYWILINEMTLKQTLLTIKNFNDKKKFDILEQFVNQFTNLRVSLNSVPQNRKSAEKKRMMAFENILEYLGDFRNKLAHNNPIYDYNHDNYYKYFPDFSYEIPKINRDNKDLATILQEQHKINEGTFKRMQAFFGQDRFNSNIVDRNINLSFMIYVIYKINFRLYPNTKFIDELKKLYLSYNIISHDENELTNSIEEIKKLKIFIDSLNKDNLYEQVSNEQNENVSEIKVDLLKINDDVLDNIKALANDIIIENEKKEYSDCFNFDTQYTNFTSIDTNFFNNIV